MSLLVELITTHGRLKHGKKGPNQTLIIYLVTLHCSVHITPAVQYLLSNVTTAQHELIYLNVKD